MVSDNHIRNGRAKLESRKFTGAARVKLTNIQTYKYINKHTNVQTNIKIYKQTYKYTNKHTNIQTNIHIYKQTYKYKTNIQKIHT